MSRPQPDSDVFTAMHSNLAVLTVMKKVNFACHKIYHAVNRPRVSYLPGRDLTCIATTSRDLQSLDWTRLATKILYLAFTDIDLFVSFKDRSVIYRVRFASFKACRTNKDSKQRRTLNKLLVCFANRLQNTFFSVASAMNQPSSKVPALCHRKQLRGSLILVPVGLN